jgi:hypothetical protein
VTAKCLHVHMTFSHAYVTVWGTSTFGPKQLSLARASHQVGKPPNHELIPSARNGGYDRLSTLQGINSRRDAGRRTPRLCQQVTMASVPGTYL